MTRGVLHGPSPFGKDARSNQVAPKGPLRRKGSILVERHFRLPVNAKQVSSNRWGDLEVEVRHFY